MKWLYLSNNRITRIREDLFGEARHIENVIMQDNSITDIHPNAFRDLVNTKMVNLSRNRLTQIPLRLFASMTALVHLDVSYNGLTDLLPGVFIGVPALEILFAANNHLTKIRKGVSSNLLKLSEVSFSNNNITDIESGAFSGNDELTRLNLSDNGIVTLENAAFQGSTFPNLKTAQFANNNITQIEEGLFSSIAASEVTFNLSNNKLTYLDMKIFGPSTVAHAFDFRNNYIISISSDIRSRVLDQKLPMFLAGNPLNCDCALSWVREVAENCTVLYKNCFPDKPTCRNSPANTIFDYPFNNCSEISVDRRVMGSLAPRLHHGIIYPIIVVMCWMPLHQMWYWN
jgi:Leucine-rich repeat (LRR) protein